MLAIEEAKVWSGSIVAFYRRGGDHEVSWPAVARSRCLLDAPPSKRCGEEGRRGLVGLTCGSHMSDSMSMLSQHALSIYRCDVAGLDLHDPLQ
jgi:hypothetical protein